MTILQWFMAVTLLLPFSAASAATSNSMDVPITITAPSGTGNEVFVGPFANWLNVKTTFGCGATGNGSTDDTTAIQNCINKLSSTTPVLYFPAGTYKITSALTLTNQNDFSLIGAAPAPTCASGVAEPGTVCIVWGGVANSATMLSSTDSGRNRIDRLTFNGQNNVGVLVNNNFPNSGGGDEFADDVFINADGTYNSSNPTGIVPSLPIDVACGYTLGATYVSWGGGCSEITFLRDQFINGGIGITGGNGNSADLWVWYSTFTNKVIGLHNYQGGDYGAFYNNFSHSSTADVAIYPNAEQTFDWNYSSGSAQFINCAAWNYGHAALIEGNTVVNAQSPQAIECDDQGPTILIDNVFYSSTGATPVVRKWANTTVSDLLSTGNTFSTISGGVLNACTSSSDYVQSVQGGSRCHSLGDQTTSASPPSAPTLPGTPPQYCASGCPNTVSVQEVNTTFSTTQIQTAINNAAAIGNGAVVHLWAGNYSLNATLTVPGNTFIQIIGDGYNTNLNGANPVISCGSACKAWFRDIKVVGNSYAGVGIKFTGSDQPGGRVFVEQLSAFDNANGVLSNGLANANVEIHDSNIGDSGHYSGTIGYGINVVGTAGASSSFTNVFAASAFCNSGADVQTSGGANFTLRHLWHDAGSCGGSVGNNVAKVTGSGTFSMAAARTFLWDTPGHYFNLTNFSGTSAIMSIWTDEGYAPADVYITGASAGSNLILGYVGCTRTGPSFIDTATGDAYDLLAPQIGNPAGCNNQVALTGVSAYLPESSQNVSSPLSFVNTTLAPLRAALPTVPGAYGDPALVSGVTDARIYRVLATRTSTAIDVEP